MNVAVNTERAEDVTRPEKRDVAVNTKIVKMATIGVNTEMLSMLPTPSPLHSTNNQEEKKHKKKDGKLK